jgi:hypothetical protein
MVGLGRWLSTVRIHLRHLRAIMNIAKEKEIITHKAYPSGRRKYTIPTGRCIKKALDLLLL